ncbi:putative stress response rci peptide protein [Eutypa lata UCREL1]|uniref:Putative stress response rci peptide protein n=1 Tax=Eutypa lata (strain UCR-EL1) TaxID=1287681 RepID=M7SR35_EUTLA|nr:putative stress response rci peptide protein [Eutypa lata UCREL1]
MCGADIFLGLLAILFPPLPVWVKRGLCSADSLLNILLCVLGYIPGLLHAWYVIARYPEDEGYYEGLPEHNESGHVTYVFVQPAGEGQPQPKPQHQHQHQHHQGGMNYGTTATNPTSGGGSSSSAPAAAAAPQENGGEGGSNGSSNPPPTYAEAVKGDHKVQTQD